MSFTSKRRTDCSQEYFPLWLHPNQVETVILHLEQKGGLLVESGPYWSVDRKGLPSRKLREAAEILHRFPVPIDFTCHVIVTMVRRGSFLMTGLCFDAMKKCKNGDTTVERIQDAIFLCSNRCLLHRLHLGGCQMSIWSSENCSGEPQVISSISFDMARHETKWRKPMEGLTPSFWLWSWLGGLHYWNIYWSNRVYRYLIISIIKL